MFVAFEKFNMTKNWMKLFEVNFPARALLNYAKKKK